MSNYNATCLITGKKDNLRMHALRDSDQNMIGWFFVHESVNIEEVEAEVNWKFKARMSNEEFFKNKPFPNSHE